MIKKKRRYFLSFFFHLIFSSGTVYITISGINDNRPIFERAEYMFTVSEDLLVGDVIGRVKASDLDGDSLVYSVLQAEEGE